MEKYLENNPSLKSHKNFVREVERRTDEQVQRDREAILALLARKRYGARELSDKTGIAFDDVRHDINRDDRLLLHPNLIIEEQQRRTAEQIQLDRVQLKSLLDSGPHSVSALAEVSGIVYGNVQNDVDRVEMLKNHPNLVQEKRQNRTGQRSVKQKQQDRKQIKALIKKNPKMTAQQISQMTGIVYTTARHDVALIRQQMQRKRQSHDNDARKKVYQYAEDRAGDVKEAVVVDDVMTPSESIIDAEERGLLEDLKKILPSLSDQDKAIASYLANNGYEGAMRHHRYPQKEIQRVFDLLQTKLGLKRSELRSARIAEIRLQDQADQVFRDVWNLKQGATIFVDAQDFAGFSQDQKNEYLYLVSVNSAARIIVYNENGKTLDPLLEKLLKLNSVSSNFGLVIATPGDLEQALAQFSRPKVTNIHLSKTLPLSAELIRSYKDKILFFKEQGELSGTLSVALLWALSNAPEVNELGVAQNEDGSWTVSGSFVQALQRSFEKNLVFSWSA